MSSVEDWWRGDYFRSMGKGRVLYPGMWDVSRFETKRTKRMGGVDLNLEETMVIFGTGPREVCTKSLETPGS